MREAADRLISKVSAGARGGLALGDERGCVGLTKSAHSYSYIIPVTYFPGLLSWNLEAPLYVNVCRQGFEHDKRSCSGD